MWLWRCGLATPSRSHLRDRDCRIVEPASQAPRRTSLAPPKTQYAEHDRLASAAGVPWMIDAIEHLNFVKIEGTDAIQTRYVDTVLLGVGAALMVSVDAASGAEVVLGRPGVEFVG